MACFDNTVTVQHTTDSVYSLERQEFTLSVLNDLTGSEFVNGEAMGQYQIDQALRHLVQDMYGHDGNFFSGESLLENKRIGYPQKNRKLIPPEAGKKKGFYLELANDKTFAKLHISSLSLFLDTSGNYNIEVWDTVQNRKLDTIAVSSTANQISTTYVDKTYSSDRRDLNLAFIYDPDGSGSYQTLINESGCLSCGRQLFYRNSYLLANAVTISSTEPVVDPNLKYASETGGLMMDYTLQCDHLAWLCTVKNLVALPLLYKACELVCHYALKNSRRLNSETLVEDYNNKLTFYMDHYQSSLDKMMRSMPVPNKPCFNCKKRYKTVSSF